MNASRRSSGLYFALGLTLLSAALLFARAEHRPVFPPFHNPPLGEFAVLDVASTLTGARRFGAGLAFIQMLQYYATPENRFEKDHDHTGLGEEHQRLHSREWVGEGIADLHPQVRLPFFPLLQDHVRRTVLLDPYFHYATLFGAGALGFNLNRYDQAFELLRAGASADPTFWKFQLYAGALAYRRSAETGKVVALLEEAILYPDCPTLLENILANIHKKLGNFSRADQIYVHILQTSRDEEFKKSIADKLHSLRKEHSLTPKPSST